MSISGVTLFSNNSTQSTTESTKTASVVEIFSAPDTQSPQGGYDPTVSITIIGDIKFKDIKTKEEFENWLFSCEEHRRYNEFNKKEYAKFQKIKAEAFAEYESKCDTKYKEYKAGKCSLESYDKFEKQAMQTYKTIEQQAWTNYRNSLKEPWQDWQNAMRQKAQELGGIITTNETSRPNGGW